MKYGENTPVVLHHSNKFQFSSKYLSLENKIEAKIEKGKLNSGPQNDEGDQKGRKAEREGYLNPLCPNAFYAVSHTQGPKHSEEFKR